MSFVRLIVTLTVVVAVFFLSLNSSDVSRNEPFIKLIHWLFKEQSSPVIITGAGKDKRNRIADEYIGSYLREVSDNVFWINASSSLGMAQSFYEIVMEYNIETLNKKNIIGLMHAVYKKFKIYQTLYVFAEGDLENKFLKTFIKMVHGSLLTDILITTGHDYLRERYAILNYELFLKNGILPVVRTLNSALKKKYGTGVVNYKSSRVEDFGF